MKIFIFSLLCINSFSFALEFVDQHALGNWNEKIGYVTAPLKDLKLEKIKIQCDQDRESLYPTHPQQMTKHYHVYNWAQYNHGKLTAEAYACDIKSKHKNVAGTFPCIRATIAYEVMMSDLYQDRCGNFYRAYWQFGFLKKDESMGTLLSKGRTVYPNMKSDFPENDFYEGQTYKTTSEDFLFLTVASDEEVKKAKALFEQALKYTHDFNIEMHLFDTKSE